MSIIKPALYSVIGISVLILIAAARIPDTASTDLTRVVSQSENTTKVLPKEVSIRGWLPWWRRSEIQSTLHNIPYQVEISPFYLTLTAEGTISQDKKVVVPTQYRSIPTIANEFDQKRVAKILESEASMDAHINDLVQLTINSNYPGIEIDYENISREYREQFTIFIQRLNDRLDQKDKQLYVALHAKTSEFKAFAGAESQDYQDICKAADKCTIMAYDKHWKGSSPGPVTPYSWLKEVIAFAQTEIPNEKLVIGLPLYGYEWPTNKRGSSRTYANILAYIAEHQYPIIFDEAEQTPYIDTGKSQLWFDNEQSILTKMNYARSKGIYQFALWSLGGEGELTRNIIKAISTP